MSTFKPLSAAQCRRVCPDAARQLEKATANAQFLQTHYKQLVRKYAGQWIAIAEGRVIGHGADLPHLSRELAEMGFGPTDALTHFVSKTPQVFIL